MRLSLRLVPALLLASLASIALGQTSKPDEASKAADVNAESPAWTPVGAARVDITPPMPIRLHGYAARQTEATSVAQKIWTRALAIGSDEGEGPAVLISVDVLGVPHALTERVRTRLEQTAGVRKERVAICATHTHTGPLVEGVAGTLFGYELPADQQQRVHLFTREMEDRMVQAASEALRSRRPARLSWSVGSVGFAANRRTPDGPVDHRLPTLVARDADGQLVALLATYACHCTTLGAEFNQVHGDWAGCAAEQLEAQHQTTALITIGCGADANPAPRTGLELAQRHGQTLADEVTRLLKQPDAWKPIDASLDCRITEVDIPFDTLPDRKELESRVAQGGAAGYHAQVQLERMDAGKKLPEVLPYRMGAWRFGKDLTMVFLAGEVVVDYALRMSTDFDGDRLWIHAYANDAPCYIPSRRVWNEGGYEAGGAMIYYDQPTRLVPEVEDLIIDTAQRLLHHDFYSAARQRDYPPPRSWAESLASMHVADGLRVELVAGEPLVIDPVAFDWGPDGRLWVVQMHDYPNGLDGRGRPGGSIAVLTDDDDDGRYDRSELFADGLPFPTGIQVWRDGVLVTAAPDILFLSDRDGDGRAEVRETLYTGFGQGNQQHRVNGLRWGLDNWIYVGNGDSGGTVRSLRTGHQVQVSGRDLRIRPDTGDIQTQSGQTQFGRCRDDWGNWFGGNNSDPLWHYVLDDNYLRRNPYMIAPSSRHGVPEVPGSAPVFPASRTLERFNDLFAANRFTSACSPIIYRDNLLGDDFHGNSLVCEPVHNLIHREIVHADGVTFTSHRADSEQDREFLAAEDHWFRPVMVRTGPDGAVWIADMYRYVIEHPTWIPEDFLRKMDVRAGDDMGRIWRIAAQDHSPRPFPRFDRMDTPDLVQALDSPNGWQRDMAQQMLLWRADSAAIPLLRSMVRQHARPLARLHALCTLDGLGAVDQQVLLAALEDAHPAVRRHAIRIWEINFKDAPELPPPLAARIDDPDPQVQMQLAYSLGNFQSAQAAELLAVLLMRHASNDYLRAAAMSSLHRDNAAAVARTVLQDATAGDLTLLREVAYHATALCPWKDGEQPIWFRQLARLELPGQLAVALGTLRALEQAGSSEVSRKDILSALAPLAQRGRQFAEVQFQTNADSAEEGQGGPPDGQALRLAIEWIGRWPDAQAMDYQLLGRCLGPQFDEAIQMAAIEALERMPEADRAAEQLFAQWSTSSPQVRSRVLAACLSRPPLTEELLVRLREGQVERAALGAARLAELRRHSDPEIRRQAEQLLGADTQADRAAVVERYGQALTLEGDGERGREVFSQQCASCHRLQDVGEPIGPDLSALTNLAPHFLLESVLAPNKAVEEKYLSYTAYTVDGKQFSGMVVDQSSNHLVLSPGGKERHELLRTAIEELRASGKSLMPEGLEAELSMQQLADLIAYLQQQRPAPKSFPGNRPEVVRADSQGRVVLQASQAAIYGPRLIFEQKNQNLGWWERPDDYARWDLIVPSSGTYQVTMDYACPEASAGSPFLLTVGGQTLRGQVQSTGSWDSYRGETIGQLTLPAGRAELRFQSGGAIRDELLDLRRILLHPIGSDGGPDAEGAGR